MNKAECEVADWYAIGVEDGSRGKQPSYVSKRANACHAYNIKTNRQLWNKGRNEGLKEYCQADNAYRIGANGHRISPVCNWLPRFNQELMQSEYNRGKLTYGLKQQIKSLREAIKKDEKELKNISKKIEKLAKVQASAQAQYANPVLQMYRLARLEGTLQQSIIDQKAQLQKLEYNLRQTY